MTLSAKLQFGDNIAQRYNREYMVDNCVCHLNRNYNHNHPDSAPRCERIQVSLNVPDKEDLSLMEWFIEQSSLNGRISIDIMSVRENEEQQTRYIFFDDAVCYSIKEHYDVSENKVRQLILELDAQNVKVSDVDFQHL